MATFDLTRLAADDTERQALERASTSVAALLSQVTGVRPYPAAMHHVRRLASAAQTSVPELADAVESDVALATRVLRLVNSAAMGLPVRVTTVRHAVGLLGMRAIADLASAAAALSIVDGASAETERVQQHALGAAAIARELAPFVGAAADEAFTAALLLDVGELMWLQAGDPDVRERIARDVPSDERARLEREGAGYDHAVLGAAVLEGWGLPAPIPEAVLRHHAKASAAGRAPEVTRLVTVVRLGDLLVDRVARKAEPDEDDLDLLRRELEGDPSMLPPATVLRSWPRLVAAVNAALGMMTAQAATVAAAPASPKAGASTPPPAPPAAANDDDTDAAPRSWWRRLLALFGAAA